MVFEIMDFFCLNPYSYYEYYRLYFVRKKHLDSIIFSSPDDFPWVILTRRCAPG